MNSTIRSNVTVGPPVELLIYRRGSLTEGRRCQYTEDHPFFREIYARGIADIRIILFREQPVMSMLRIPTDASDGTCQSMR